MPNDLVIVDNLLLIKSMMKMMIVPLGTTPHSQAQHSRKYRTVCFRWIWSKPKDWWREKRVSHLLTSSTAPSTRPAPLTGHLTDLHYRRNFSTIFTGAMWMMSSTRWSERLERETRRESSKKTKHRVGKKFGTIFSKRSSAAGARFKETSFVQFFLNSDRRILSLNSNGGFTKNDSIKDLIEICTKKQ